MGRRRKRSGRSGRKFGAKSLVVAVAVLVVFMSFFVSTGAFSAADASRLSKIGAASDSNAQLGLWVNTSVQNCQRQDLVEVTNDLEEDLTVTVSLNDGSIGTLYADSDSGDSVSFPLPIGNVQMVELDADHSSPPQTPFDFTFNITGSGDVTFVEAPRTSTLEGKNNCGGGPPGGGGGSP